MVRTKRLEQNGVSRNRYFELVYFSRQYAEYRRSRETAWCADLIEAAARNADGSLAPYILRNVTGGQRYEYIAPPCGINQFYHARQRYFIELDRLLARGIPRGVTPEGDAPTE